ncbi:hypothetical protein [Actinomadura welshii]|uniref:hypothetical protein n=1 Tax=Actinomadura welshii TaxID=3103817 RepID=UPI0003AD5AD8|nr:hypothetical protein [Actinomadura madurae]
MDEDLAAVLARLDQVFAPYPRRAVLDGCPHCRPATPVDEDNLFPLTLRLGGTVGGREYVKSLLPLLFERMVTSGELDGSIVLSTLTKEQWRHWPSAEQQAIDDYLDAVWRSLLRQFPSRMGAFFDAAAFLQAAATTGDSIGRYLAVWDTIPDPAADRHLAQLVNEHDFADARRSGLTAWLCREVTIDRLISAFERDHDAAWADDLAMAYDLLSWHPRA